MFFRIVFSNLFFTVVVILCKWFAFYEVSLGDLNPQNWGFTIRVSYTILFIPITSLLTFVYLDLKKVR